MAYHSSIASHRFTFPDLATLLAKASPYRSGDALAGLTADSYEERIAAQFCLADLPLVAFLDQPMVAPETDEVSRLILSQHDTEAFEAIRSFTVGMLRDFLLGDAVDGSMLHRLRYAWTPEMVAAVSKIMRTRTWCSSLKKRKSSRAFATRWGERAAFLRGSSPIILPTTCAGLPLRS
jgi:ethanolamine ammonia-lyase large subunit